MAETIRLKGKAVEIYDYHKVDISKFISGFSVDEAKYEKDLGRILRSFGRKEQATQVCSGDTITINSKSSLPRFCRDGMTVMVGKGLLDDEFEAQLIGMTVGVPKTISACGAEASVTVVSVTHTVLPELTDESVASFGMDGVSAVSDLRRYCIGKQVDNFLLEAEEPAMASAFVWQEMAAKSKIARDPEEVSHARAKADEKLRQICADEDAEMFEDKELFYRIFMTEIDTAVIGCSMMEQDGAALTCDDYDRYIQKLAEAYPDRSRDELMREYDAESFAIEHYSDYLAQKIDAYVAECYKAALCG